MTAIFDLSLLREAVGLKLLDHVFGTEADEKRRFVTVI